MQTQLPKLINAQDLACLLGVSERAVRKRAKTCRWPLVFSRVKGGKSNHYLTAGLPEDVRAAITDCLTPESGGPAAEAGRACAKQLLKESARAEEIQRQIQEASLATFNRLPEQRQRTARAREHILKARDAFLSTADLPKKRGSQLFAREFSAGAINLPEWVMDAASNRKGRPTLSWATLQRWEKAYEELGIAGLSDGYKPGRRSEIPEHMAKFIEALILDRPDISNANIKESLLARFDGKGIPTESSIRRFVVSWKRTNASLYLYITNPDAHKSRCMPAFGNASEDVTRLNQLWEFDSTPTDVMLIDGRHAIIGVIDVYSRRAMVYVSPTSKGSAICALIRKGLIVWGVTETAKTDNGADYTGENVVRVLDSLDVRQELCAPFSPEQKPHIERFFRTMAHSIQELLPGYIGHSVADRKAIESRRTFAQRLMSQGNDPIDIQMTAEQLQETLDSWCEDVYQHKAHNGLGGKTPYQMAREWMAPIRRIKDVRALDILLAPAPNNHGMRTIAKKGIKIDNAWFIADELGGRIGEQVFILLDATDYGTIHVFTVNQDDGSKSFLCTAVNPDRTGHDRMKIAERGHKLYREFMKSATKKVRRAARDYSTETIHDEIMQYYRRKRANIADFKSPSVEHTSADLEQASMVVDEMSRKTMGPQPIPISEEEEKSAAKLIDMAQARRNSRPLPATAQEKYEQLNEDLRLGIDICDADLAWMKRYELWLETGDQAALY